MFSDIYTDIDNSLFFILTMLPPIVEESGLVIQRDESSAHPLTSYITRQRMEPQELRNFEVNRFRNMYIGFKRQLWTGLQPPYHMYIPRYLLGKGVNIEKANLFHILDNTVTWEDDMEHEVRKWHAKKLQLSPTSSSAFSIWYEVVDRTITTPKHYSAYLQINNLEKIGPMRLRIGGKWKKYDRFFYPVIVIYI